jgi:hypothetical protein
MLLTRQAALALVCALLAPAFEVAPARASPEPSRHSRVRTLDATLDVARIVLSSRRDALEDDAVRSRLDQELVNITTAEGLLAAGPANADRTGRIATAWQARLLDAPAPSRPSYPQILPSEAARQLLERFNVSRSAHVLRALDRLSRGKRSALSRVLAAFVGFDAATRRAYPESPSARLPRGARAAALLGARTELLRTALDLDRMYSSDAARQRSEPAVQIPPVLAIDPYGTDTTYKLDFALVIDVGGNDTYMNNAGGNGVDTSLRWSCSLPPLGPAGALIDLEGDDRYIGNDWAIDGHDCGVNGGGYAGAGFLFDAGGNDRYEAEHAGTNGGGSTGGIGFLLDAAGNDVYKSAGFGGNGGGGGGLAGGVGCLIDRSGDDVYISGSQGANGGGWFGSGFLFDSSGRDRYVAGSYGTNGAGLLGTGFLLDASGNDTYDADVKATNGGGLDGSGFLLDAAGNDRYTALPGYWANGGGSAGSGVLIDANGNDRYVAGDFGTNGGGADHNAQPGSGFLLDGGGDDFYKAGKNGVNGGEGGADAPEGLSVPGRGLLLDMNGRDVYSDGDGGTGTDCTMVPKGYLGAQIDWPESGC